MKYRMVLYLDDVLIAINEGEIPESEIEPTITLTKEEAIAFMDCPFSSGMATHNYPGYNEVVEKIFNLARKK